MSCAKRKYSRCIFVTYSFGRKKNDMFRAIGVVIILWYLSSLFSQTFLALDRTATATLSALEAAAVASEKQFAQ